jgi:alpha-1,3/alpha-1,6-mannosyltransferase
LKGGAEKLVVDTAILVKKKGHEVSIVTCHHDKTRCFQPTMDGMQFCPHLLTTLLVLAFSSYLLLIYGVFAKNLNK